MSIKNNFLLDKGDFIILSVIYYRSIKHYFLLDKGDFIVQFMDMTEDEMRQNIENIIPTWLETLLELALRTSTTNTDQFKDQLRSEPIQQIWRNAANGLFLNAVN